MRRSPRKGERVGPAPRKRGFPPLLAGLQLVVCGVQWAYLFTVPIYGGKMLKFSLANAKIKKLYAVESLQKYLKSGRKVFSFDLLSGWSCPFASICKSKVVESNGKKKIVDGPNTEIRCFSASQEVIFKPVYNLRKNNYDVLRGLDEDGMFNMLSQYFPSNCGILRWHVGGDFFNRKYFNAALKLMASKPDVLFYFYTKSLPYLVDRLDYVYSLPNVVFTASWGGLYDNLITEYNLRSAIVVGHPSKTTLDIDDDDNHAANPELKYNDFALLIHGIQPKGSDMAKAIQTLKKEGVEYAYN